MNASRVPPCDKSYEQGEQTATEEEAKEEPVEKKQK
jgi:hypothetical protein